MHAVFAPSSHRTVDSFQSGVRQVCGNYAVRCKSSSVGRGIDGFGAHTGLLRQAGTEIAYVRLSGLEVQRSDAQIRRDFVDHFVVTMQLSGVAEMTQGATLAHLRPNDVFVSDATRSSRFRFDRESEQVSLHIARSDALTRFGRLIEGPVLIPGSSGFAIAMRVLLQRMIWQTAHGDDSVVAGDDDGVAPAWFGHDTPDQYREALFSVLTSALVDARSGGAAHREPHDHIYDKALCIIHQQANDPAFTPGRICDELGISPRQLQRSFARHGDSARDQILSTRLERARRRIQSEPELTVTEAAYGCGFSDLSFFYRAFRRQFGSAPGERRRPQQVAADATPAPAPNRSHQS
ncbi:helix-turn-helix domain-containing protein [Rhodopseudomonas sp. B29]|uniref:helix-turn-helix domain-containing protein n=1 Tax=Rhodopseudomonas sp. B29 TaxID=95607 RepID=UPI00034B673F|nr:helix-turn-helix domain-containing protein [Rhodopseudomonas sp. B29]